MSDVANYSASLDGVPLARSVPVEIGFLDTNPEPLPWHPTQTEISLKAKNILFYPEAIAAAIGSTALSFDVANEWDVGSPPEIPSEGIDWRLILQLAELVRRCLETDWTPLRDLLNF